MTRIFGDRVRQARVLRHGSGRELAAALGRPPAAVTRLEAADTFDVDPGTLATLVAHLRFPEQFFTTSPARPIRETDLLFRAPKSMTKREKSNQSEFARMVGELLAWVGSRDPLPPVRLPGSLAGLNMVEAAQATRVAMGIEVGAPIDFLTHPVERAGVPVVVRGRGFQDGADDGGQLAPVDKHLGYSTWAGEFWDRPLVVMRPVQSWERTRWTLAHEVGHLVLHKEGVTENAEDEASAFANEFLAPINVITGELPRIVTLWTLLPVKDQWGIAIGALIRHLHRNGVIDDERKDTLQRQLYSRRNPDTGRTYGVDEPGWDARSPERPRLVSAWATRFTGTASPEIVAAVSGMWPADLIAEVLTEQRTADDTAHAPSDPPQALRAGSSRMGRASDGKVVDLASRRTRR